MRAACGSSVAVNHVTRAPASSAVKGCSTAPSAIAMAHPAAVAVRAAITLVFMPPFDSPDPASPAIASISGVIASISGKVPRVRVGLRVGGVKPVHVGQEHADIGARHERDLRRQPVIVAITDLIRGDCVVFVDNRNRTAPQEGRQRRARV